MPAVLAVQDVIVHSSQARDTSRKPALCFCLTLLSFLHVYFVKFLNLLMFVVVVLSLFLYLTFCLSNVVLLSVRYGSQRNVRYGSQVGSRLSGLIWLVIH